MLKLRQILLRRKEKRRKKQDLIMKVNHGHSELKSNIQLAFENY